MFRYRVKRIWRDWKEGYINVVLKECYDLSPFCIVTDEDGTGTGSSVGAAEKSLCSQLILRFLL
jgi:hypothetical protein